MTRGIYASIVLIALCAQNFIGSNTTAPRTKPTALMQAAPASSVDRWPEARVSKEVEIPSGGPLPGIAQPAQRVEILAPQDGVLDRINVREGQLVKAGEILAQFDDKLAKATVRVAEAASGRADIELAEVDLQLAEAELQRLLSVTDRRALAGIEIDRAKGDVKRANAAANRARQLNKQALQTLEVEKERLQQLYLKAPFNGVVVRISTQAGASLTRSTPVITVANLDRLKVELFASLEHFDSMTPGERYQLTASAPVSGAITAQLVSREPVIDPATKTFRCVFEIENTSRRLPAGFTVLFNGKRAAEEIALHLPEMRSR